MSLKVLQEDGPRAAGGEAPEQGGDQTLRRGVANPRIVDLIAPDPERGEVVLKMLEPRPWGASERQLHQLEDKINSYLGYVLDGFLVQQYPRYKGVPVRFQLECVEEPSGVAEEMLRAAARFCKSEGLAFAVRVIEDPSEWRVPWEEAGTEPGSGGREGEEGDRVGRKEARVEKEARAEEAEETQEGGGEAGSGGSSG